MPNFLKLYHPVSSERDIRRVLGLSRQTTYSKHFEEDVLPERSKISKDLIEEFTHPPKNLDGFNYEEDRLPWPKYILLFDKSNKYWLRIVISLREKHFEVVTAHLATKRKNSKDNLLKRNS